jgi:hypothetical protein
LNSPKPTTGIGVDRRVAALGGRGRDGEEGGIAPQNSRKSQNGILAPDPTSFSASLDEPFGSEQASARKLDDNVVIVGAHPLGALGGARDGDVGSAEEFPR